jgi:hypothetical protein
MPCHSSHSTHILLSSRIAAVIALAIVTPASAQLAPEIGYVHPAGAQAGSTVEVTLGGYDWTPDMQLFVHDPRIKLELLGPPSPVLISEPPYWFGAKARGYAWPLPREFKARLTVPADVPPGLVKWQVANANGVSPVGVMHIGNVAEVVEDAKRKGPQILPSLPVAVSGQIRRIEEIDRYRIRPTQSGPITIELLARQLTSPNNPMCLHGMLQVHDATGRKIVDVAATEGLDLVTTFAAEAGQDYTISLHDVDFAGDRSYVYRLVVTPGPRVVAAYPSAGKRGETRPVEFVGIGVATGAATLESITKDVAFPADPAATTFTYVLETPFGTARPYIFPLSDAPELLEGAMLPDLPWSVTGAIDARFGSDDYCVPMKQGDTWNISARSRTSGPPLDLELSLVDPAGKEVAAADDVPGSTDAELIFTVPEDGVYRIIVTDRSGHSGDRGANYRLSIEKPREDFAITLPDLLSMTLGGTAKIPVAVARQGGFRGPIAVTVTGLPEGVSVPADLVIPEDKNDLMIDVTSAADAAVAASLVQITATATLNGAAVARPVKSLVAATIMKPRIKITPEGLDDVSKVRRGSTRLFPLLIERLEGFAGEITLEMTAKQQRHRQGLASDEMIVPADAKRVEYPIFVPEWMETTKTSRMILNGAVKVPDPKGNVRTLLQRMELRLGILPEGALMKLSHAPGEYQAVLGGTVSITLTVSRTPEFREPVRIELVPDADQTGLISAEPQTWSPAETSGALTIRLAGDARLVGEQAFLIRATAYQGGKWLVKSETTVTVDVFAK